MKQYKVAVLGATGAVGREMIKILEERNFPISELIPLASARSAGSTLKFCGKDVTVREVTPDAFAGVDIVLGASARYSRNQPRRCIEAQRHHLQSQLLHHHFSCCRKCNQ